MRRRSVKKNIGATDSWIRGLLGLELFFLGFLTAGGFSNTFGIWCILIALFMILTAIIEYSPIYALLRIMTRTR